MLISVNISLLGVAIHQLSAVMIMICIPRPSILQLNIYLALSFY